MVRRSGFGGFRVLTLDSLFGELSGFVGGQQWDEPIRVSVKQ